MLYTLTANQPSFKSIRFRTGLNIILIDRPPVHEITPFMRTQECAVKSSILDLLLFLLAGKPEGSMRSRILDKWTFELRLDVGDEVLEFSRGIKDPRTISIKRVKDFQLINKMSGRTCTEWLEAIWFRKKMSSAVGAATFRLLMSYFARRRRDGGYDSSVCTIRHQAIGLSENNLAVLFGLDFEKIRRLYERINTLKQNEASEIARRAVDEAMWDVRKDLSARFTLVDYAGRIFSDISERMCGSPGQLHIKIAEQGLRFLPSLSCDERAGGISTEIFCFDLTVASLCGGRGLGPGFLVHDGYLFEPLHGKYFAKALRIAADVAQEIGFQYIVALDSEELTRAESAGQENFRGYVVTSIASDTRDAGLFGIKV